MKKYFKSFFNKIPLVSDASLFGNCLQDLTITELLVLEHSLNKVNMVESAPENRYLKETQEVECVETEEGGKCSQPSSLALVAEGR